MRIFATTLAAAVVASTAALAGPNVPGPEPRLVDFTFGPAKLIHVTCSSFTGEPVLATHGSGGMGGSSFLLPEADYQQMVREGVIRPDAWRTDKDHPAYGKGC